MANNIGTPNMRHQAKEASPVGNHTQQVLQMGATPSKTHPQMESKRLVSTGRRSVGEPEAGTCGESSEKDGETNQDKAATA